MKKKIAATLLVLFALLVGAVVFIKGKRYEVVISQQQIDNALAGRFPVSKKYLGIFEVIYSNPQVTLLEDRDRIQVGLEATLNIRINQEPKKLGGGCTITAGIRYDSETQEFFLDNAEFDRFEIHGIPDAYLEQVAQFASKAAREFVESKPIYRLKAKDTKSAAAKLLLKNCEVRDQSVQVTLGL
ncbi:MAG: hypothetical protein RLZZ522_148 [Verrucomicrobiota bacterium]